MDEFSKNDIHIHVPAGAIPKDGPSAGISICASLASLFMGKPIRNYLGMTGEITLKGNVLPIGGVKEKLLAARRAGVNTVILPEKNRVDMADLPKNIEEEMNIIFVETIEDVIKHALKDK